jgi:hypothetical protein
MAKFKKAPLRRFSLLALEAKLNLIPFP